MRKLMAVSNSNAGFAGATAGIFRRLVHSAHDPLNRISHSTFGVSEAWQALAARVQSEFGCELVLVYKNRRSDAQLQSSAGREPCVLIEGEGDDIAMIMDWNDLKLAKGNIESFERILRAKLLMY
jgi:hypothetical protein